MLKPNLIKVKMLKLVTLVVRSRYSHERQNKIDYETQFPTKSMLKDKHEQKIN